ncbi:hypothetical protein I601_0981 [Nocardioides dokdonensis FR1436]|uniref:Uncharacterized protein n=1 Tax=Nocardioides dokdonensis FR1436 TaxID=1300347 RepID=A0A1A9GGR1_9ACTN|nr:hypothetical protein [Nocardioides dokdonensis]ANH37424.1 hypothetical protein I601_0981 [Nocardioides dokdonensis FR1436]
MSTSMILLVLAVLVVLALVVVAVVLINQRNSRLRAARAEQAGQLRAQAAAHDGPIAASRDRADEAAGRAAEARREAQIAEREAAEAERLLAQDQARQEDQLRTADHLDPHGEAIPEHPAGATGPVTEAAPAPDDYSPTDPAVDPAMDPAVDPAVDPAIDPDGRHRA